jgi:hypothetical protein
MVMKGWKKVSGFKQVSMLWSVAVVPMVAL